MLEKIPKTSNIKNFLQNYKKIIAEIEKTNDPVLLFSHNQPLCVLVSLREYNSFVSKFHDLHDYRKIQQFLRIEKLYENFEKSSEFRKGLEEEMELEMKDATDDGDAFDDGCGGGDDGCGGDDDGGDRDGEA